MGNEKATRKISSFPGNWGKDCSTSNKIIVENQQETYNSNSKYSLFQVICEGIRWFYDELLHVLDT